MSFVGIIALVKYLGQPWKSAQIKNSLKNYLNGYCIHSMLLGMSNTKNINGKTGKTASNENGHSQAGSIPKQVWNNWFIDYGMILQTQLSFFSKFGFYGLV